VRVCFWSIARGTALGSILGILPGGGALLASFAAYMFEKKIAKPPRHFGEGDIRGVAARNPPTAPSPMCCSSSTANRLRLFSASSSAR
jgi:TctA family transporter